MALIPLIQPPIMKLLTTKEARKVKMSQLRAVSKTEKIIFPIAVTIFVILLIPDTAPLIGMLMLGNLFRESGVTERLSDTAQNALINIVTIPLGLSVGFKATYDSFLTVKTLSIVFLGLFAFMLSTAGGIIFGNVMYVLTKGKVNPLIGSAGVSAVPMAARVSQVVGQKCSHGRPRVPGGGPEGEPRQLPAHARHGPQRGRCYRFRCCGRFYDQGLRRLIRCICPCKGLPVSAGSPFFQGPVPDSSETAEPQRRQNRREEG